MKKHIPKSVRQYGISTVFIVTFFFVLASLVSHTPTAESLRPAAPTPMGTVAVHTAMKNAHYAIRNEDIGKIVVANGLGTHIYELPIGNYRVDYKKVEGFKTPEPERFQILEGGTFIIQGDYRPTHNPPLLGINVYPPNSPYAIYDANNRLMISTSGAQFLAFPPGRYRIEFKEVGDFNTPRSLWFMLKSRTTTNINALYSVKK